MIKQYPHYLFVKQSGGDAVQDNDGNWVASVDSWVLHSICREETNGKGDVIRGQDGKDIVFGATVYLPKTVVKIQESTEVLVCNTNDETEIRVHGTVLKFDVAQQNCRLWL